MLDFVKREDVIEKNMAKMVTTLVFLLLAELLGVVEQFKDFSFL